MTMMFHHVDCTRIHIYAIISC